MGKKLTIQPTTTSFLKQQAQDFVIAAMDKKRNRQLYTGGLGDIEKDKLVKQKQEEGKIALRQQYSQKRQELSAEFLEGMDDTEREKQADARIMAAKKGASYAYEGEEEEEGELEDLMEDISEDLEDLLGGDGDEDEENKRKTKKQKR